MESMAEGGGPPGRQNRVADWGELSGDLLAAEQLVAGLQQGVGGVGTAG